MWTHSFLGVDGLPTTLTRMCLVGGASYSGGLDWTGQVTSQLLAPRADSGRGVQDGGRAEEGGGRKPKE